MTTATFCPTLTIRIQVFPQNPPCAGFFVPGGTMLLFEIEMDEDQVRAMVRNIIHCYERGLHEHGSQQVAIEVTEETTVQSMENTAEAVEELIENKRNFH